MDQVAEELVEAGHFSESDEALDWLLEALSGPVGPKRSWLMSETAASNRAARNAKSYAIFPELVTDDDHV